MEVLYFNNNNNNNNNNKYRKKEKEKENKERNFRLGRDLVETLGSVLFTTQFIRMYRYIRLYFASFYRREEPTNNYQKYICISAIMHY